MYLGIYLKKNNKTNKQKKTKQTKTGKKKKEKKREERKQWAALELCTFDSLRLYLTTTPLRLMTSSGREVFYLMPFPRKLHQQTSLKMIEPRKTALLTVKNNNNNKNRTHFMATWMKEHTLYALQNRYTSSAKYDAKHIFSYLVFSCYLRVLKGGGGHPISQCYFMKNPIPI